MNWLTERFELARGGDEGNVRSMEGLRGFAVCLVFLVHYVTLVQPWIAGNPTLLSFAKSLHAIGNTGVDLFFVLSGYLIYGSLIVRPQPFLHFMSRRVERIYPAFLAVFCIYVVLSLVFPTESKIPSIPTQGMLYLVQNLLLLPGMLPIEPMITVAWSLSYEMFYYIAIPLIIALLALRARHARARVTLFLALASGTALTCAVVGGGHVRLIMFLSGILLWEALQDTRAAAPGAALGAIALVTGLASALLPVPGPVGAASKSGILFVAFFVFCLACLRDLSSWLPRMFCWKPLRWLGNMSYSYYLLHGLALKAAFLVLAVLIPLQSHGPWLFWALLPVMFVLTLCPTVVLFLAVERPYSLAPRRPRGDGTPTAVPDKGPESAELAIRVTRRGRSVPAA